MVISPSAPRDLTADEWIKNEYVTEFRDCVRLKSGFWFTELKLPITSDFTTCRADHWIYSKFKYDRLFASPEWLTLLDRTLPELSDGILHLGSASHYHYILHGIGNLSSEMLRGVDKLYVDFDYSDDQANFLEEIMSILTSKPINVVRVPKGVYRTTNVILPRNKQHPDRVRSIKSNIDRLGVTRNASRQRLYVSRRKAATRRLINEDEFVEEMKSAFEFQVIENESLNLKEQLLGYSNAEFVVGPHGAGLANIVFAKNPRALLEFWHSVKQPFFENLSCDLNVSYLAARGKALSTSGGFDGRLDNNDFIVDPRLALRCIELLVTKSPPRY